MELNKREKEGDKGKLAKNNGKPNKNLRRKKSKEEKSVSVVTKDTENPKPSV